MSFYMCPLEATAHPLCDGCAMLTEEDGKLYCHYASKNFLYPDTDAVFIPVIWPAKVGKAEVRIVKINGEDTMQINGDDLEKIPRSTQEPLEKIKAAWDATPPRQTKIKRSSRHR